MKSILYLILMMFISINMFSQHDEPVSIVLGQQLENPYSTNNMQLALAELKKSNKVPDIQFETTNLYVRFLPSDSLEFDALTSIEDLELYDHPFDYEIVTEGNYYHDPNIPLDQPTWLYTTINVNYNIPNEISNIQYEILENLFLPPDESEDIEFYNSLEELSFQLTNNSLEEFRSSRYYPSGQILVSNPYSGTIIRNGLKYDGVPRVKGRVRRWYKIRKAYTNNDGYFTIGTKFRGKVNFGVIYKNSYASILPGPFSPLYLYYGGAFLDGPKRRGHWEYRSERGSSSYKWGAFMRAIYDYHNIYAPNFSIAAPPSGLRIAAFHFPFISNAFAPMFKKRNTTSGFGVPGLLSDIYIDKKNEPYRDVYNTMIHELGHAAHWDLVRNWAYLFLEYAEGHTYQQTRMATEAWSDGIENNASKLKFNGYQTVNFYDCSNLMAKIDAKYPKVIVRDLMDTYQSTSNCEIVDNVFDFSLNEIFYSLQSSRYHALEKWRDNLIQIKPEQEENLREYFAQWIGEDFIPCSSSPLILNENYTAEINFNPTHSNSIILSNGFNFKAINSNYHFSANINCNFAESARQNSGEFVENDKLLEELISTDFVKIPNTSIIISPKGLDNIRHLESKNLRKILTVYPNPTKNTITIESSEKVQNWIITSTYGKSYFTGNITKTINMTNLPKGIYFLKAILKDGNVVMKKIIKN